jgi:hypothetical protein
VVEPGGAKPLPQAFGERLLVAQDDTLDDSTTFSVEAWGDRAGERRAQPIRNATEPAAPADHSPAVSVEHDVHAVAPEPGCLVETALRRTR